MRCFSSSALPKAERLTLAASCSAADAMDELPFFRAAVAGYGRAALSDFAWAFLSPIADPGRRRFPRGTIEREQNRRCGRPRKGSRAAFIYSVAEAARSFTEPPAPSIAAIADFDAAATSNASFAVMVP